MTVAKSAEQPDPSPLAEHGLFAGGLVALFAGFGVAEATRRKALATTR